MRAELGAPGACHQLYGAACGLPGAVLRPCSAGHAGDMACMGCPSSAITGLQTCRLLHVEEGHPQLSNARGMGQVVPRCTTMH